MTRRNGDIVRVTPTDGRSNWARHNILIYEGGRWYDTYSTYQPDYVSDPAKVGTVQEIGLNMNDLESTHSERWEQYADTDRFYIPMGGGSEKYLIRRGAEPDRQRVVEQLEWQLSTCEAEIKHQQWRKQRLESDLAEARALREVAR